MSTTATTPPPPCCPKCGYGIEPPAATTTEGDPQEALAAAQKQIADLQAQVRLLSQKASAAVDRWADYEDELARLRAQVTDAGPGEQRRQLETPPPAASAHQGTTSAGTETASPPPPSTSLLPAAAATHISRLLSSRTAKSSPNLKTLPPVPSTPTTPAAASHHHHQRNKSLNTPGGGVVVPSSPTPSTDDLLEALSREQSLRRAAEGKLNDTSREVEELSATLFEQANEMVATERRARAKLEERVGELERRDVQKRARLERLEQAMGRIERVRALLNEKGP